jgi:hypothetical protein
MYDDIGIHDLQENAVSIFRAEVYMVSHFKCNGNDTPT